MGAIQTVKNLKNANQDYEWYPTTKEIIEAMYWDLLGDRVGEEEYRAHGKDFTMLDIGAGDCKVLKTIKEIAESQPLLSDTFIGNKGKKGEYTCHRNESERYANRIFITKYMAIEKSSILTDLMPKEVLVVGTDFHENTLVDKQSDIVFCNPPYSEYAQWTTKIIREANAKTIYLVIPQRWGKHKSIAQALKDRKAKVKVIGNFDFLNAEDRKARAYVSLVKVELNYAKFRESRYSSRDRNISVDPFDLWFYDTFKISAEKENLDTPFTKEKKKEEEFKEKIKNEVVEGNGLVSTLVQLYNKELDHLLKNYQKLSELDSDIFKELNIDVKSLLAAFKEKIRGLKNLYWTELFDNLSEITSRLTSKSRDKLKSRLMADSSIDFTESNIRSVVIWVIKNANYYYKEQMLELYDTFTTEKGIKLYKSNQHFVKDDFRYNKREKNLEKYALDYRIILHNYADSWDVENNRLSANQYEKIRDLIVIAKNLGFSIDNDDFKYSGRYDNKFYYGEKNYIFFSNTSDILKKGTKTLRGKIDEVIMHTCTPNENGERVMEKDGVTYVYSKDNEKDWIQYKVGDHYCEQNWIKTEKDVFTSVRPYKNGNNHFQFNKKFMQKFNLEVGRIRGWLKNPAHAAEEMDITVEEATEYWNSSFTLLPNDTSNLLSDMSKGSEEKEGEEKILCTDDFEKTPDFDPHVWWKTSAKYDNLKEGDLLYIISEVDFSVIFDGKEYRLEDKQGAYLGDIGKESFNSILECAERLEDTYFPDYFGTKYDCDCSCCGKAVAEDDYCFESHDGKALCDACAILCEGCNKYYTEKEGSYEDGFFVCNNCKKNTSLSEITLESQMLYFAEQVIKHFQSGDVFGGIKDIREGKLFSTSYVGSYQLFKINKEYREGKVDGIAVYYKRDDKNNVIEFVLTNVFFYGKIPFKTKNTFCKIPMAEMKKMILEADNSIDELQKLLLDFVKIKPTIAKQEQKPEAKISKAVEKEIKISNSYDEDLLEIFSSGTLFDVA